MGVVITPGAVRVRSQLPNSVAEIVPFVAGNDLVIEVQQRDGEWVPLRGITDAAVRLVPDGNVTGRFEIELCGIDIAAPAEAVLWRTVTP